MEESFFLSHASRGLLTTGTTQKVFTFVIYPRNRNHLVVFCQGITGLESHIQNIELLTELSQEAERKQLQGFLMPERFFPPSASKQLEEIMCKTMDFSEGTFQKGRRDKAVNEHPVGNISVNRNWILL